MDKESLLPPHLKLAMLSRDYVVSRCIHVIAKLGIADHMSSQPVSVDMIAQASSTVPELLERLLSFLSAYGLFEQHNRQYALTPLSFPLQQDDPHSIKDILCMVDESWWNAFSQLETSLKTGHIAFNSQHGLSFFDFLNTHPETKAHYEKGLARLSMMDDQAIAAGFDFGQFNHLITVGGKKEELPQTLSRLYPHLLINHLEIKPPFLAQPLEHLSNADAILLKAILHDHHEKNTQHLLNACHRKMKSHSTLLIAEQVIPDHHQPHTNKTMDIVMMTLVGGRQRTITQWQELVETEGFMLTQAYPAGKLFTILEFKWV